MLLQTQLYIDEDLVSPERVYKLRSIAFIPRLRYICWPIYLSNNVLSIRAEIGLSIGRPLYCLSYYVSTLFCFFLWLSQYMISATRSCFAKYSSRHILYLVRTPRKILLYIAISQIVFTITRLFGMFRATQITNEIWVLSAL